MTQKQFYTLPDQERLDLLIKHKDGLEELFSDYDEIKPDDSYYPTYPLEKELVAAMKRIQELEKENERIKKAEENSFTQGYVCAVANMVRHYDQPTIGRAILRCQCSSLKDARAAGVDEYDIEPLRKLFDRK